MRYCLLALTAAFALVACGSDKEGALAADDSDLAYRIDEGEAGTKVSLNGPDGEATVATGQDLKPDLPKGIAVYPGASVTTVSNVGLGDSGTGTLVAMDTADAPQKVTDWYKAQAKAAGYGIEAQLQTGDLHMISGKAADGREFSVTATAREAGSSVQLIAGSNLGG